MPRRSRNHWTNNTKSDGAAQRRSIALQDAVDELLRV